MASNDDLQQQQLAILQHRNAHFFAKNQKKNGGNGNNANKPNTLQVPGDEINLELTADALGTGNYSSECEWIWGIQGCT